MSDEPEFTADNLSTAMINDFMAKQLANQIKSFRANLLDGEGAFSLEESFELPKMMFQGMLDLKERGDVNSK